MNDIYGLIGGGLSHSISPQIHSIILKTLNINGYYHLFELKKESIGVALNGLKALNAKGINVTIPYKTEVIKHLDELSDEALRIGAINTIKFEDSKMIGYNTDYFGLKATFDRYDIKIKGQHAIVLGSGGVSITLIQFLKDHGIGNISILCRDLEKVKTNERFKDLNLLTYSETDLLTKTDLLINCTPCGMFPNIDDCVVDNKFISKFGTVIDLIYNPGKTKLLKYSLENGSKSINGLYMLVSQAVSAQKLWNGIEGNLQFIDLIYSEVKKIDGGKYAL
jgi:shikimate dehydrogenase